MCAVIRELTKKHETVNRGYISDIIEYFNINQPKGEFVIVLEGENPDVVKAEEREEFSELTILEHFNSYIEKGLDEKSAMKAVAKDRGIGKREVYSQIKK